MSQNWLAQTVSIRYVHSLPERCDPNLRSDAIVYLKGSGLYICGGIDTWIPINLDITALTLLIRQVLEEDFGSTDPELLNLIIQHILNSEDFIDFLNTYITTNEEFLNLLIQNLLSNEEFFSAIVQYLTTSEFFETWLTDNVTNIINNTGAALAETEVVYETPVIGNGEHFFAEVNLGKHYIINNIAANAPCRVRLYRTSAYRLLDIARPIGDIPEGEHGVILDVNLVASNLNLDLSPIVTGSNADSPRNSTTYILVTNTAPEPAGITIDFRVLKLQE
jgi:hypothetical protein